MHSHLVPPEIIRESKFPLSILHRSIFLHSAHSRSQALVLSLVCKEAHAWIVRVLYQAIAFSTRHDLLQFGASISSRPEHGIHIRSLYIGSTDLSTSTFGTFAWVDECLAVVHRLLTHSPNIERLALVNLPPGNWQSIEERLPPRLKTLAVGPSYGLLRINVAHQKLQRFYYVDTILQSAELARIAELPSLTDFRWRSPLRFDDVVYGQLKILLSSLSLKRLHVTLFGSKADMMALYRAEYEELVADGRLTIVCDPLYEGSREWISHFDQEW